MQEQPVLSRTPPGEALTEFCFRKFRRLELPPSVKELMHRDSQSASDLLQRVNGWERVIIFDAGDIRREQSAASRDVSLREVSGFSKGSQAFPENHGGVTFHLADVSALDHCSREPGFIHRAGAVWMISGVRKMSRHAWAAFAHPRSLPVIF